MSRITAVSAFCDFAISSLQTALSFPNQLAGQGAITDLDKFDTYRCSTVCVCAASVSIQV